jgi:hypothetical protein
MRRLQISFHVRLHSFSFVETFLHQELEMEEEEEEERSRRRKRKNP